MDITPLIGSDQQVIQGYSAQGFKVSGQSHSGALFVYTTQVKPWDYKGAATELKSDDFAPLIEDSENIDVVLLGCGKESCFIAPSLKTELKQKGLVLETMDTGAACRTYNVLMSDGRRVVAALLPCGD